MPTRAVAISDLWSGPHLFQVPSLYEVAQSTVPVRLEQRQQVQSYFLASTYQNEEAPALAGASQQGECSLEHDLLTADAGAVLVAALRLVLVDLVVELELQEEVGVQVGFITALLTDPRGVDATGLRRVQGGIR